MTYQETIYPARWRELYFASVDNAIPTLSTDGIKVPENMRGKTCCLLRIVSLIGLFQYYYWQLWGYCPGELDADGNLIAGSAGWVDITGDPPPQAFFTFGGARITYGYAHVYNAITAFDRVYFRGYSSSSGTIYYVSIGFTDE